MFFKQDYRLFYSCCLNGETGIADELIFYNIAGFICKQSNLVWTWVNLFYSNSIFPASSLTILDEGSTFVFCGFKLLIDLQVYIYYLTYEK